MSALPPGWSMFESLLDVGTEPVELSPFEGAAWAVGAHRTHGDVVHRPEITAGMSADPHPRPESAAERDDPRDGASTLPSETDPMTVQGAEREPTGDQAVPTEDPAAPSDEAADAGGPIRLMLLEEPPLEVLPPDPGVSGTGGSGPGPRITALAAATGAAVRRGPRPPTISRPQPTVTSTPARGQHLPGAEPPPSGGAAVLPTQAEDRGVAAMDASSGQSRAGVFQLELEHGPVTVWLRDDIPPTPEHAPAPARVAPSPVEASAANEATKEQPAIPETPPAPAEVPPAASTATEAIPDPRPTAAAVPAAVDLADDDDFGPLVLPEPARRTWPRLRRTRRSPALATPKPRASVRRPRVRLVGAALGLAVLVAAAAWWAVPRLGSATTQTPPPGVSMVVWQGMALPVSASDGPTMFTTTRVGGFARTDLGAALAAAHLSVRTDPVTGRAVFEPVLADQTVGARDRLATAVRDQSRTNPPAGAPGTLLGWRLDGDSESDRVTAHLAVEHADGTRADYAVAVAWVADDWRLDVPASGAFFPISALSGEYAPFVEEASQ